MTLRFNSDGTFRVLQMADIQDGPNVREDTIRLIEAAIKKTHPDLIVFTGDQIRGYDPAYIDTFLRRRGERPGTRVRIVTKIEAKLRGIKRHPLAKALREYPPTDDSWMIDGIGTDSPKLVKRNKRDGLNGSANKLESWAQSINRATAATILDDTRQKVRDTFAAFLGPALEARIPFAATYGNHDFQCGILADEQDDIYREFSGCMNPVAGSSPLALEPGTFAIPIEASDGSKRIAMSVMMVNSGDYADNAFDGDCSISDGCERVGDTDKSGNTVGNTAGGRESLTSYAKYASNSRGWDLADSDGYGTPSPEAIEWLKQVQRELGRRNGDGRGFRLSHSSIFRRRNSTTACAKCPHTHRMRWRVRERLQGIAMCWIVTCADLVQGLERQSDARMKTLAKCRRCAMRAAISRYSAGMTIRTRSSGMFMTLILATRRPADLNATVRNRGCAAFVYLNSAKTIRSAT